MSEAEGTPRKTLDEIRRELDADYSSSVTPGSQNGGAVDSSVPYAVPAASVDANEASERHTTDDDGFNAPVVHETRGPTRRRTRRLAYIVAGVAGCLAGQLVLIGILIAVRQWHSAAPNESTVGVERTAPPAPQATSESHIADQSAISDDASAQASAVVSPTTPEPVASKPEAVAGEHGPVVSERGPAIGERSPAPGEPSPRASEPKRRSRHTDSPITTSGPAVGEPRAKAPRSERPPAVTPRAVEPPAPPPSEGREEPIESRNWAQSQDQVRAALGEWLARSGHRDDTNVSDIVVILGADGRTARTHVPLKSGSDVIVREQRWERGANGWQIMDDREAWRAR